MNILVPHSWLKEFVKTEAAPETVAEKLSLCSLSVEKLHQRGGDTVYEIEITPNRYDTLSVLGIAREVAAVLPRFGIKAELGHLYHLGGEITDGTQNLLEVTIGDPSLCPRFTAIVLDNIEIKPSPKIIKDRLEMSGVRALNNVVDVSNYLMLELGQPMHIFDFDKIVDGKMILRESKKGEKLTTLDGVSRTMLKGAIVIESGGQLIDLCGIMGGQNSEVDENTKRILLFIQIYDSVRIRKTSQELALRTEASTRFEKGIDPERILPAMDQAVEMLKENAGAKVSSKLIDIKNKEWQPHEVELEITEVERLLGVRIEKEEIIKILKSLGFEITVKNSAFQIPTIIAKVPSWRDKDITIPADLVEEIARLYGYHNLPSQMPDGAIPSVPRERKFYWEDKAKDFLKHQGFYEVYNYSFINFNSSVHGREPNHHNSNLDSSKALKVRNPLSAELEYLRPSLLPSLLQNLSENQHHTNELKLFELERVYLPVKGQELPQENFRLTGVVRHELRATSYELFYIVKGIVEGLLKELGIKDIQFSALSTQHLASAKISSQPAFAKASAGRSAGIGTIEITDPTIVAFDLDFDTIAKLASDQKTYEPIPEYPPIIEDLSLIVDKKTLVRNFVNKIEKHSKANTKITAKIIDIYQDKNLEAKNKKSVTFRLTYQAKDRTLKDREVQKIRQKIITSLEKTLKAKVRKGN